MRYELDLRIEPANTIGIVDKQTNDYYFVSGQEREKNLTLAMKLVRLLNQEGS